MGRTVYRTGPYRTGLWTGPDWTGPYPDRTTSGPDRIQTWPDRRKCPILNSDFFEKFCNPPPHNRSLIPSPQHFNIILHTDFSRRRCQKQPNTLKYGSGATFIKIDYFSRKIRFSTWPIRPIITKPLQNRAKNLKISPPGFFFHSPSIFNDPGTPGTIKNWWGMEKNSGGLIFRFLARFWSGFLMVGRMGHKFMTSKTWFFPGYHRFL